MVSVVIDYIIFITYQKGFKSQIPYKIEKWSHSLYQTMINDPDMHGLLSFQST